jgi:hypothetical protein
MPRCRYTYRRPCCTEYNPDYYSTDQIKWRTADHNAEYNADYNAEYNAISVSKLYYREYNPEYDPDSDSTIPSYSTTMTIDDYQSTSESTPNQALPIDVPYEAI